MALRPPSLQKTYDDFYSGDPAFEQAPVDPPENATPEDAKYIEDAQIEHGRRIRVARETGNWSSLLKTGGNPTKFVMRPVSGSVFRALMDRLSAGKFGVLSLQQLLFRAAIVNVVNLDEGVDAKVETVTLEGIGTIATADIADRLDSLDKGIVRELGDEAFRRARDVAPKS